MPARRRGRNGGPYLPTVAGRLAWPGDRLVRVAARALLLLAVLLPMPAFAQDTPNPIVTATIVSADRSATATIEANEDPSYTLDLTGGGTEPERDANLEFTVTLSASPPHQIAVEWATTDGSATAGSDYTAASDAITFAAAATGAALTDQFTVALLDDSVPEGDHQFTVSLRNPTGEGARIGTGTATVTIVDNDTPTLSIADASVDEGVAGGMITFPVTLSPAAATEVTVAYATADGSATTGVDYTAASGTLTFAPGGTSATISIAVTDDTEEENDETFTVTLSNPSSSATLGDATATGTIKANDARPPELSLRDARSSEGDGSVSFTVELDRSITDPVTATWSTADGTATAADYTAVSNGLLTIGAGSTSTQITVSVTDDTIDELNETFTVRVTSPANAELSANPLVATGTIEDDDLPTVTIAAVATTVIEGSPAVFTVSRTIADSSALAVSLDSSQTGTFASGALPTSVTIPTGATSQRLTVTTDDDTVDETNGTLEVTVVANAEAYVVGTGTSASVTIEDDDQYRLSLTGGGTRTESNADVMFTVTIGGSPAEEATVDWRTADGTANSPSDYTGADATLTFAADTTTLSQQFTVSILDDDLDEPDEQFTVTLSNAKKAALGSSATATVKIEDDDVPTIDIKDVTADEDDAAGTIRFPVALSLPSALAITVDYVTADDTATVTEDYVAARGTLTFPVGTTERTIAVALVDDGTDEPASESLTVTLSGPSATATLGEAVATGTIVDDEDPPMVSIRDATAEEGDASITFTVELSGPSSGDIGVTWSTQDGTATAPYDYTPVTGASVVIAAGELTATLTVTLNLEENQDDEPDKLFRVKLAAISSGSAELADTSADGVVADDDLPRVTITPGTDVTEGEDAGFTLQRVGVAEKPLTINLAVSQVGQVLKTPQALPETATFDAGSLQAGVAIATDDDDVDEANGSIAIAVQNGQAYNLGDPAAAAVTVRDNDLPIVSIASAPSEVTEGNDLPVGVTRAGDLTEALEVQLMFSATEGYSMEEPRVSGGFAAASSTATLTASVVGNTIDAPDGTVTVALVTQDRAYRAGSSSSTTVTVRDDDTAGVPSLFVSDTTCAEQTSVCNVHVFVSEGPKENFEAILYTENGTAIGGRTQGEEADFVAARITFFMYASNHGYGTYDIITILADDLDEHDETFIVRVELAEGTSPETATLGDVEAVVTIIDNDDPPTLAIADAAASEGAGSMRFSLSLSPASGRDVVVDWLASAGSATAPADYTETSGTVTIAAGDTSANLDVPLNDDFASEQSETFEVAISAVHATVTDELAIGRIEDNDRALTMTVSPAVIAEGESATVTVQTDGTPVATDQTITLALSGSAREGASNDYTVTPRSITIPANAASGSATIAALDDTRVEGDETILIDARRGDSPVGSAEITISDNDRSFGLTVTPAVIEEAEDVTVTVTVTTPGGDTFDTVQVVTLALSGTATEGMDDDYTLSSTSISIAVDATYGTAVVTVADDALVEGNETITITATHEGSRIGTSTITIEDDDEANFTLSVAPDTLNEGAATTATVTVAMPAGGGVAFDTDQTVILALSGSATEGADFTIVPDHITIPAGGTAGTAAITPLEDTVVEGAETITITATHGATRIGSTDVTIEDNDVAPLTMTIADAALNEGDTTTVTVATDGATFAADQTIVLELTGSTATATDDFVVTPQEITILANTMSGVASVAAVDDVQVEDSETIAITARHDGAVIGTGTITIADNDTANFGATVDPTTIAEGEGTAVVVETGGVSFPEDQLFAVDLSGTATAGEDYTVTPPTITVAAGSTSGSAAVTALDDTLVEEAETIDIVVSRDGTTIDTLEVTISASDQSSFGLTVEPATVVEGGSVSVTATTGGVTFTDEQIVSLRFTGSATDRTDFTISPTRITIPAGATSGQAIVTTIDDSLVEGDETITIAGSHGDDQIGSRNVTIADNDAASFALTVEPATIDEGATAVVTVAAAEGIDFDSDQIVTLVLGGTATRGAEHDYTISATGITIAAGETSGTATVTTLETI